VADDVAAGRVTADWGERGYGVVLAADGTVDVAATESRRAELRRERLAEAKPWSGEEST
jgi:N-methylhydantoinase B